MLRSIYHPALVGMSCAKRSAFNLCDAVPILLSLILHKTYPRYSPPLPVPKNTRYSGVLPEYFESDISQLMCVSRGPSAKIPEESGSVVPEWVLCLVWAN
ncbi:hypothetical protein K491DRAFT_429194 [Lophiostoma macrostomum CBS 122681]|uniref:Uncharacterized protein n=1 Tax=Lophiostoma macrostomum CBS 122681 TaxID=1314788 RepID=A0A6A6T8B5_9PLEO|nr:hypothetical protein K491DRAFT_429194 [Lophiostoma macrostomum CBS 122681]